VAESSQSLPLPTLLSHLLVAYVVELDNEFERRVPHRREGLVPTAENRGAPRLVSVAMWATCLRYVPDDGITVAELEALARTDTNLDGVRRWGYVTIAGRNRVGPARTSRRSDVLMLTEGGRRARDEWSALVPEIEGRWAERFGSSTLRELLDALVAVSTQGDAGFGDCLPILGYGLWCGPGIRPGDGPFPTGLYALLSRVLLAFAVEAERESTVSLAIGANVLRRIGADAVPVAQLPARTGIGREAIATCLRYLEKQGMVVVGPDAGGGRARIARLTERGRAALTAHGDVVARTEANWRERLGAANVGRLRAAAATVALDDDGTSARLLAAIRPFAGEWRSEIPPRTVLPDFPMVLHRGGWPDGS
jgi:DNA-binding MarR family transcriptional regulator